MSFSGEGVAEGGNLLLNEAGLRINPELESSWMDMAGVLSWMDVVGRTGVGSSSMYMVDRAVKAGGGVTSDSDAAGGVASDLLDAAGGVASDSDAAGGVASDLLDAAGGVVSDSDALVV